MIKHKIVSMKFDSQAFSEAIKSSGIDYQTIADCAGVHKNTVTSWVLRYHVTRGFDYPSMTNFINVCNLLDLNCASFFVFDE